MSDNRTTVITQRHPWSLEEKLIMSIVLLVPAVMLALHFIIGLGSLVTLLVIFGIGLVCFGGLFYLGSSRKKKSELTAKITGNRVSVQGNKLAKNNAIELDRVTSVASRVIGINPTFILTGASGACHIPLRIAKKDPLKTRLVDLLEKHHNVSESAQQLLVDLKK